MTTLSTREAAGVLSRAEQLVICKNTHRRCRSSTERKMHARGLQVAGMWLLDLRLFSAAADLDYNSLRAIALPFRSR